MASDAALHPVHHEDQHQTPDWNGGGSPFNISYGKLMMWYFLLSDAFTFASLLISYGALRFSSPTWADPNKVFSAFPGMGHANVPLGFVSVMTFILILSSVFVVLAVIEGHRNNKAGVMKYMIGGIVGGIAFLGCQAWEWTHLIHEGMTIWKNPFGPQAFGMLFFLITGFHGFHVFSGVVLNIWAFVNTANGEFGSRHNGYQMIEKVRLYWHFVDLVWVFVFLAFYLL